MKHFTIVGNWKMHQAPDQAERLVTKLQDKVKPQTHVTNVICPPYISLHTVGTSVEKDLFRVGAQNIHEKDEGAYTGEISGPMLKGLAEYVIIGHSERRRDFNETDKQIAQKAAAALRCGLKPILCVGEKLDERDDGHSKRVVVDQLHGCLSQVTEEDMANILIAYEPVWAIGTGEFATPDQVIPVVSVIRETVEEMFGESSTSHLEILYGGSVDDSNAATYLALENINGLLVGGASLNYEAFSNIIASAGKLST